MGCCNLLPSNARYKLLIEMEKFYLTKHRVLKGYMLHIIAPPLLEKQKNSTAQKPKT